jgi:hypothetical protein
MFAYTAVCDFIHTLSKLLEMTTDSDILFSVVAILHKRTLLLFLNTTHDLTDLSTTLGYCTLKLLVKLAIELCFEDTKHLTHLLLQGIETMFPLLLRFEGQDLLLF